MVSEMEEEEDGVSEAKAPGLRGFGPRRIHWLSVPCRGELGLRAGEGEVRGTEGLNLSVQLSQAILFKCETKAGL